MKIQVAVDILEKLERHHQSNVDCFSRCQAKSNSNNRWSRAIKEEQLIVVALGKALGTLKKEKCMSKIVVVNGDDWEGLYLDGVLYTEDHFISPECLADCIIENSVKSAEFKCCDLDWMHDQGTLPQNLSEVVWDA